MRRYFSILFFVCCSYAASAQLFVAESSINLDSIETDEQGAKKLSSLLNVNHKQEFLSIINEGYVLSTIKHHFILTGKTSQDIYVISLNAQAPALLQRCYVFLSIKGKAYYTNADTILVDIASTKPVIPTGASVRLAALVSNNQPVCNRHSGCRDIVYIYSSAMIQCLHAIKFMTILFPIS